jgi:uncharacterized protein YbjT (DUF2867 family)
MGVEARAEFPLRKLELHLERSGMAFTHVRPNYFLQNFCSGPLLDGIRARGEISVPMGDGAVSFVDVRDISAVVVEALVDDAHRNAAYTVTGAEAVTHHDIAAAISDATGRRVRYRSGSEAEERAALAAAGASPERIERRLGFLALARGGALSTLSTDVAKVLGREPITLRAFARDHAATFRRADSLEETR